MSYTDSQMRVATQIAYMDVETQTNDGNPLTVGEFLEMQSQHSDPKVREQAEDLQKFIASTPGCENCEDWIIRDVKDDQHGSGMYACMLDTGDGDALVAFRGSEANTAEQVVKDWVLADAGLLNSTCTIQQYAAERYTRELYEKYGNQYYGFGFTGHSLGGNLAEHAAITAPTGMRDQITQCVNMDGPGYSQEYIIAHMNDIMYMKDKIVHYQWSAVGGLLTPIPGGRFETVEADGEMFGRHSTSQLRYDENGNVIQGNKDWLTVLLSPVSVMVDARQFVVFPNIFNLLSLYENLKKYGIAGVVERWTAIFNRGNATQFEVDTQVLRSCSDDLCECGIELGDIGEEIMRIQNQLSYSSLASGYIRNKLWFLANKFDSDGRKLRKLGENGSECGYCYSDVERLIQNNYV